MKDNKLYLFIFLIGFFYLNIKPINIVFLPLIIVCTFIYQLKNNLTNYCVALKKSRMFNAN